MSTTTEDPFLDTPELRAERKGENPRYHWCHRCGWRWETGKSGEHNCLANVMKQRDELAKALEEFVETRNDIDDDTMEQWAVMVDESAPISQAEAQRHVDARTALAKIIPK